MRRDGFSLRIKCLGCGHLPKACSCTTGPRLGFQNPPPKGNISPRILAKLQRLRRQYQNPSKFPSQR